MDFKPIDVGLMRSVLAYDPSVESCLVWKTDRVSGEGRVHIAAGAMAGYKNNRGYWDIGLNKKLYKAHRIVYAILTGEDPPCQVDHIDGNRSNNAIENLRLATRNHKDNGQNSGLSKNNTSGFCGVCHHKATNRWVAYITVNRERTHLGTFDTPEEAYAAYLEAKKKYHIFNPAPREV